MTGGDYFDLSAPQVSMVQVLQHALAVEELLQSSDKLLALNIRDPKRRSYVQKERLRKIRWWRL